MLFELYLDYNYFDFDCLKNFFDFKLFLIDFVCRILRDWFLDRNVMNKISRTKRTRFVDLSRWFKAETSKFSVALRLRNFVIEIDKID
jgi:hypothetical protein